ncbi:hypothetical protein GPN2_10804 [Streptomyces murinus]
MLSGSPCSPVPILSLRVVVHLRRELLPRYGVAPSGVPHHAAAHHLRGFGDQVHVSELIIVIELQERDEAAVEDPEVLGRKAESIRVGTPEVTNVLTHAAVPLGVVEKVKLARGRRLVHDAHPLHPLALVSLRTDCLAVRVIEVPIHHTGLHELPVGVSRFVACVPPSCLQPPGGVLELREEAAELFESDAPDLACPLFRGPVHQQFTRHHDRDLTVREVLNLCNVLSVDKRRTMHDHIPAVQVLMHRRTSVLTAPSPVEPQPACHLRPTPCLLTMLAATASRFLWVNVHASRVTMRE